MVVKICRRLTFAKVINHWNLWHTQKMSDHKEDLETGNRVARRHDEIKEENVNRYKEVVNTHMIVAALIATVGLTAGFAVPCGFDGNKEPSQHL